MAKRSEWRRHELLDVIQAYGLRAIGIGERLLPRSDFTLCDQFVLIGSGMLWNVYFAVMALMVGFFLATALAVAKGSGLLLARKPAEWFIFVFRGSPLFIQFFFAYFFFLNLKGVHPFFLTRSPRHGLGRFWF